MSKTFTPRWFETVKPELEQRHAREFPDPLLPRHYFVVQPTGAKSWAIRYRLGATTRKFTTGPFPLLGLAKARELAREALIGADRGIDPGEQRAAERRKTEAAAADTLKAIAEEYLAREGGKLRTANQRRAILVRLVYPKLGKRPIGSIKRSEIIKFLDNVEDERGPRMADVTLQVLSRLFNWHSLRDDDFLNPIVRGMARQSTSATARKRILTDEELARVWTVCEANEHPFGAFVRFLLLTATRRNEAADLRWSELDGADWIIPAIRYKTGAEHVIPLSEAARKILEGMPRPDETGEWVFPRDRGLGPIRGFGWYKAELDRCSGTSGWTLHDLRRTARSLMSRAGVPAEHAERALGHVAGGVRGTYDRHEYHREKAYAFEALAAQIERILNPPTGTIVPLRA
jgi:integrase